MMKVLKVALPITLAVGLVLGIALPGLANSDETAPQAKPEPRPRMLRGVVDSVDYENQVFSIKDESIKIHVNQATRYFKLSIPWKLIALRQHRVTLAQPEGQKEVELAIKPSMPKKLKAVDRSPSLARGWAFRNSTPVRAENQGLTPNIPLTGLGEKMPKRLQGNLKWLRQFGEPATFADITVDDRVVVWAVPNNNGFLAKLVLIIEPTAYQRVSGTIYIEEDGTITVENEEGKVNLEYDEHTIFTLRGTPYLESGMKAMVIYVKTGDGLLAKRVTAWMER